MEEESIIIIAVMYVVFIVILLALDYYLIRNYKKAIKLHEKNEVEYKALIENLEQQRDLLVKLRNL